MKKFSRKTFIFAIISVIIALLVMDLYIWTHTRDFILSNLRQDLSRKVSLARQLIDVSAVEREDRQNLKEFADEIKKLTEYRTTIINKQGEVLADSEVPIEELNLVENHLLRSEVQQALRTGSGLDVRTSATIDRKLIYYCEPLRINGRIVGFIRFAVFSQEYRERTAYLRSIIIQVNLILFIFALIAVFIYWKWFKRQLMRIQTPVMSQRDHDAFISIPEHKYEEFDLLRGELNALGEKLEHQKDQLRMQRDQMSNILHSLSEGVAAFGPEGYLLFYNKNFIRILQLQQDLAENSPYYDWIHFPPLIQDIEKYLRDGQEVKKRTKYYKETVIEYQILPLHFWEDNTSGFILTVQDATHLQQLETIRQDFVANVSHEFKTPLTSIRGYAETLLAGMDDNPEIREKFLKKIMNRTKHLENLVVDLLQLSRIERKETAELKKLELKPVLLDIMEEFKPIVQTSNLTLKVDIDEKLTDVYIYANKNLLHTVISNLMTNAIQYNGENGEIRFRARKTNKTIRLEVEDTGIGIPENQLNRIFERFYRIENARTAYPEGSGLGLSIIRHAVSLLNGQIGVDSKLGEGSTFWVEIPTVS
ncbi:MAG: hypothetical protein EH225_09105 [Calditrichaeota bacterium]|nr:hypothetical protein [Calditrichota bacterium]RQW01929.1 MAG: hypothetical protein EH225_09105 [Calditrichota bacterium]